MDGKRRRYRKRKLQMLKFHLIHFDGEMRKERERERARIKGKGRKFCENSQIHYSEHLFISIFLIVSTHLFQWWNEKKTLTFFFHFRINKNLFKFSTINGITFKWCPVLCISSTFKFLRFFFHFNIFFLLADENENDKKKSSITLILFFLSILDLNFKFTQKKRNEKDLFNFNIIIQSSFWCENWKRV